VGFALAALLVMVAVAITWWYWAPVVCPELGWGWACR
jgi:hypothetical protein